MARYKKFNTVEEYLQDKWGDMDGIASVKERAGNASDEFMAGWLTAHTTIESNAINFPDPSKYFQDIVAGCRKFMGLK